MLRVSPRLENVDSLLTFSRLSQGFAWISGLPRDSLVAAGGGKAARCLEQRCHDLKDPKDLYGGYFSKP